MRLTGQAILTLMLMIIMMMAGDLLGTSLTTDNVQPSPLPNSWRIGKLTIAVIFMGISALAFCTGFLRRRFGVRPFPAGAGHSRVANASVLQLGVRKSGNRLRCPRPWTNLVIAPSLPLAGLLVRH